MWSLVLLSLLSSPEAFPTLDPDPVPDGCSCSRYVCPKDPGIPCYCEKKVCPKKRPDKNQTLAEE